MTSEERIADLEARIAEVESAVSRNNKQLLENRARIEGAVRMLEDLAAKLEETDTRLEQYKAQINMNTHTIERHHMRMLEIMTQTAAEGAESAAQSFLEAAMPLHELK